MNKFLIWQLKKMTINKLGIVTVHFNQVMLGSILSDMPNFIMINLRQF